MFLLTNKALIWVGKGQKRKAHHHHDVGCVERFGARRGVRKEDRTKAVRSGTSGETLLHG